MTFYLRDPAVLQRIIQAASPQNFDYKERYELIAQQVQLFEITESIRTLTILSIASRPFDLYADLFKGWNVVATTPLNFYRAEDKTTVIFCSDWTIRLLRAKKDVETLYVNKLGVFTRLSNLLKI